MENILENALVAVESKYAEKNLKYYDVSKIPFGLHGVYKEDGLYRRLPYSVAEATSASVAGLSQKTSGGRFRFMVSKSTSLAIKVEGPGEGCWDVSPITGMHAFDCYHNISFGGTSRPVTAKTAHEHMFGWTPQNEVITLNFPLSGMVSDLYIGVDEGVEILSAPDYSLKTPILFYGSSITQGMCATRPGMIYQNHLCRWLDFDYINLGFSGSAKAEPAISAYVASLDPSIFVYDYDHNAPDIDHLRATHEKMFLEFRAAHPDTPVLMMSRPNRTAPGQGLYERMKVVEKTYLNARERGDENVWFIPGNDLLMPELEGNYNVDSCHPNDFGFYSMARAIKPVLEEMIAKVKARGIE